MLIKEDEIEAKDTANKIVVTATIESSSEDGDDQQEEGINSRSNSINELPESKKPKDVEQRRIGHTSMDDNEPMLVQQYPNDDGNEGINADSLIRKESVDIVSHKDECLETKSNSSESIPDALDEPPKLNLEASEGQLNKDEEETTSDQSIPADTQFEEMTKDAKVEEINSTEAVEWNMKMANMGSSADTRSLSTASLKNDDEAENVIKEHQDPVSGVEMVVTTDTLVSKENVKIEVTRRRKKTEPASFESFDSVDDNPPMPAPRTETPVSEVCKFRMTDTSVVYNVKVGYTKFIIIKYYSGIHYCCLLIVKKGVGYFSYKMVSNNNDLPFLLCMGTHIIELIRRIT